MPEPVTLVGRSSSHYTRTARMFALDLGVPFAFRPVLDMTALDPGSYGDNPALKIPVLIDDAGTLFGTENICRELARRSGRRDGAVLRGDLVDRLVANVEEMILHAMQSDVLLVMLGVQQGEGTAPGVPVKVRHSLENALGYLDANVDRVLAALPPQRLTSFCETALYCLVTHLPWRKVLPVDGYARLAAFCAGHGQRASAQETAYRFDAA